MVVLLGLRDPEFVLAKTLLAAEAKQQPDRLDDDWRMGLGALSMSAGAQLVLKKLLMATAEEQMEAAQIYDVSIVEEAVKRKAAGSGGPIGSTNGKATAT
jgi:hypothetical protein